MVRMIQKNDSYIAVFEHVTPKEMELIRLIENLEEEKPVHQITIEEALNNKTNMQVENEVKVAETSEERPVHRPFVFKRREPRPEKSTDSSDVRPKEGAQSAPFVFKRRDEKTACSEEKPSVVKKKDQTPDIKVEEHKENVSVDSSKDDELPDWCAEQLAKDAKENITKENTTKESTTKKQPEKSSEKLTPIERAAIDTGNNGKDLIWIGKRPVVPTETQKRLQDEITTYKECPFMTNVEKKELLHERYHYDYEKNEFEMEDR